eukprot:14980485-Heterocapsa_arctica.AAC.1
MLNAKAASSGVSSTRRGPASPMPSPGSHVQHIRVTWLPSVLCGHLCLCRPLPARAPRASSC